MEIRIELNFNYCTSIGMHCLDDINVDSDNLNIYKSTLDDCTKLVSNCSLMVRPSLVGFH